MTGQDPEIGGAAGDPDSRGHPAHPDTCPPGRAAAKLIGGGRDGGRSPTSWKGIKDLITPFVCLGPHYPHPIPPLLTTLDTHTDAIVPKNDSGYDRADPPRPSCFQKRTLAPLPFPLESRTLMGQPHMDRQDKMFGWTRPLPRGR